MKTILLVDDNAQDRALYRRYLSKAGGPQRWLFSEAATGDEARAQFLVHRPDCILLDYHLPDTDGLSLLAELLQLALPESVCVVVVTGVGNERLAVRALTNGALDYLVKQQFDPEMLTKTVLHAIEKNEWRQYVARHHTELRTVNQELRDSLDALRGTRQTILNHNLELTAANAELARSNTDLDNFIYTASHDLKAPISNIEGLLQALLVELPPETRQGALVEPLLNMMQGAVERFQLTIEQLTTITKLQQAHTSPPEEVCWAVLLDAVCLDLGTQLAAGKAQVVVEVAACPTVVFAPKNLRSIVYNLLSNALKYADPARLPVVHVRTTRAGTTTVLTVQDNGLGLDATQQTKLFGLFQRLHDHVEGSGVGLYMVKKIIENAGGTIRVHSHPGIGSTFTVCLPD
jgi:signal transduction histidine kinase